MSGLPWFKFYPSAWRADPCLRLVSLEARGLWIEMLCIMHEASPYGHLVVGGQPIDAIGLAAVTSSPEQIVRSCLHELEASGVLSKTRDGVMYSRRMVRDYGKRLADQTNGKRGGNPRLKIPVGSNVYVLGVNPPVNPPVKAGVKAKRLDTRDKKEANASVERVFDELWGLWPPEARKRHPQDKVRAAIGSQLRLGASADELIAAGKAHVADRLKSGPTFVKGLVPFLNQGLWRNWAEPVDYAAALRIWRSSEQSFWDRAKYGPAPNEPGYRGPPIEPQTVGGSP